MYLTKVFGFVVLDFLGMFVFRVVSSGIFVASSVWSELPVEIVVGAGLLVSAMMQRKCEDRPIFCCFKLCSYAFLIVRNITIFIVDRERNRMYGGIHCPPNSWQAETKTEWIYCLKLTSFWTFYVNERRFN